jgi:hypothetical protein
VTQFTTGREAKEFLVAKIVEEASHERVQLSDVERKMLYFTETAWTLPDIMEVNDEFDRDYDREEYENKIARLIQRAGRRARKSSKEEYAALWAAVRRLKKEDHYILVMVKRSGLRPPGDRLRLWETGIAIVGAFTLAIFVALKLGVDLDNFSSQGGLFLLGWGAAVCAAIVYSILRLALGAERTNKMMANVIDRIFQGRRS